jgi:phage shock protein C
MKTYTKRLYRSTDNKVIFGVMGGLGEYFDVDPVVFRVAYTAFTCFTGVAPGVLAYILMAIFMPKAPSVITAKSETIK